MTGVLAIHEPYTLGYKRQLDRLISHFQEVQFERIAQLSNKMADALAVLVLDLIMTKVWLPLRSGFLGEMHQLAACYLVVL